MNAAGYYALARAYVRQARAIRRGTPPTATARRRAQAAASIERWLAHACDARERARRARSGPA